MSNAYNNFISTLNRANKQIELAKRLSKLKLKKKPQKIDPDDISDIVRTALVLGVSAFDSYFTDKFIEIFIPYLYKYGPNKKIVSILEDAGLDVYAALELIKMDRPNSRIRNLVVKYLERLSLNNLSGLMICMKQ